MRKPKEKKDYITSAMDSLYDNEYVAKSADCFIFGSHAIGQVLLLTFILYLTTWFSFKLVVITFLCLSGITFFYHLIKYLYYQNKWLKSMNLKD